MPDRRTLCSTARAVVVGDMTAESWGGGGKEAGARWIASSPKKKSEPLAGWADFAGREFVGLDKSTGVEAGQQALEEQRDSWANPQPSLPSQHLFGKVCSLGPGARNEPMLMRRIIERCVRPRASWPLREPGWPVLERLGNLGFPRALRLRLRLAALRGRPSTTKAHTCRVSSHKQNRTNDHPPAPARRRPPCAHGLAERPAPRASAARRPGLADLVVRGARAGH
jgi:hypothetical protein